MTTKRTTSVDPDLVDQAALALALEQMRRAEPERREQVGDKLQSEGWRAAAEFAASVRQSETLRLRPWQSPPCDVAEDATSPREVAPAELLRRMLAAGVSRWHPDPLAALAKAGR